MYELHTGREFYIWFDVKLNCYFIRNIRWLFQKILDPLTIKNNTLITVGEMDILLYLDPD